jgi:hypothetical protein
VSQLPGVNASGMAAHILIFLSSTGVLFLALRRLRKGEDSIFFASSLAIVTTLLISFHSLVYDLSLLLPLVLCLISRSTGSDPHKVETPAILLAFFLLLTPVYVLLLMVTDSFFWFSLVLLGIYSWLLLSPERDFRDRTASLGM